MGTGSVGVRTSSGALLALEPESGPSMTLHFQSASNYFVALFDVEPRTPILCGASSPAHALIPSAGHWLMTICSHLFSKE